MWTSPALLDILPVKEYPDELLKWPTYQFPKQTSDVRSWVSADDLPQHKDAIIRKSKSGEEWIALILDVRETDAKSSHDFFSQPYLSRNRMSFNHSISFKLLTSGI